VSSTLKNAVCAPRFVPCVMRDVTMLTDLDCDNAIMNGGAIAPDGNLQCNMACRGNTAEWCGGPNRLDLYTYGSANGTTIP
jgi:hypothetical protein